MAYTIDDSQLPERFWAKVAPEPNTGCWFWTAALGRDGYGRFGVDDETRSKEVHRLAFETLIGPVPAGLVLDHLCRERSCCNPAHMDPVTQQENCRRGARGALHTHCPQGHELTPENTALNTIGNRYCRTCRRNRYDLETPEQAKRRTALHTERQRERRARSRMDG